MINDYKLDQMHTFIKILVVDDIYYVKRTIAQILMSAGYFVFTASSGKEAMEKFCKYSPDLITIGRLLPDMSGFDYVKDLRKKQNGKKVKLLFISDKREIAETKSVLSTHIDNLISKPIQKEELLSAIQELISR